MSKLTALIVVAAAGAANAAEPLNFLEITSTNLTQTRNEGDSERAVEVADFDKDGDMDVVVGLAKGAFGQRTNEIYINNNGVLNEINYNSGFINGFNTGTTSRTAFWRDIDGDGWLDIHVTNDSNSGPNNGNDKVFIAVVQNGQIVRYDDESLARLPNNGLLGASCGGVAEDFDADGDIDLYQGNYPFDRHDRQLMNDGTGFFTEVTSETVPIDGGYVVDVATADFNGDGKMDMVVSNMGNIDGTYVQYNNINNQGAYDGDYKYPGSTTFLGNSNEMNGLEPGDFDNDGDIDLYWTSRMRRMDLILENTGNDASQKVIWNEFMDLPQAAVNGQGESRKSRVADLNNDGKLDIIVVNEDGSQRRPVILRNASYDGNMMFLDWSPAAVFNNGQDAWEAAPADFDNDGDLDIFIGDFDGPRLIDSVPSPLTDADAANGSAIPGAWNGEAQLVEAAAAQPGSTYEYQIQGVTGTRNHIAAVINGPLDYELEVIASNGQTFSSDRGGAGVEEAIQAENLSSGTATIRVTVLGGARGSACPADQNGDGQLNGADFNSWLGNFSDGNLLADVNGDGQLTGADFNAWLGAFSDGCGGFELEFVARNN